MKVFIVIKTSYQEGEVISVYTDRKLAEHAAHILDKATYESYEIKEMEVCTSELQS